MYIQETSDINISKCENGWIVTVCNDHSSIEQRNSGTKPSEKDLEDVFTAIKDMAKIFRDDECEDWNREEKEKEEKQAKKRISEFLQYAFSSSYSSPTKFPGIGRAKPKTYIFTTKEETISFIEKEMSDEIS